MIDKLFKRWGYIPVEYIKETVTVPDTYTEDELSLMLAESLGIQDEIDSEYEKKIFSDLKGTDGLIQYLREAAAKDKDRYFGAATKEEQLIIRGAFARTMYLKSRISGADAPE